MKDITKNKKFVFIFVCSFLKLSAIIIFYVGFGYNINTKGCQGLWGYSYQCDSAICVGYHFDQVDCTEETRGSGEVDYIDHDTYSIQDFLNYYSNEPEAFYYLDNKSQIIDEINSLKSASLCSLSVISIEFVLLFFFWVCDKKLQCELKPKYIIGILSILIILNIMIIICLPLLLKKEFSDFTDYECNNSGQNDDGIEYYWNSNTKITWNYFLIASIPALILSIISLVGYALKVKEVMGKKETLLP